MGERRVARVRAERCSELSFRAWEPLIAGSAENGCRAVVIVPARDEEGSVAAALDALAGQMDLLGRPLARESYEVLLLLNNCTDRSPDVAAVWKAAHPEVRLHVAERTLEEHAAFVGTARRMLMDTAWWRLQGAEGVCGILSTDADTTVAGDWVARNLAALEAGADAVGGAIGLKKGELEGLPAGARRAYLRDRRYQRLVAELEHLLDPQENDPWPRHLEHFGASLACTPEVYARAGGMPAVRPLEDVRFVQALRAVGARLRHCPAVRVYTSARVMGRVKVGLSGQLKIWQEMSERGDAHTVPSAAWHRHRFQTIRGLREVCAGRTGVQGYPMAWRGRLRAAVGLGVADFLREVDGEELVEQTFRGCGVGEIAKVNRSLERMVVRVGARRRAAESAWASVATTAGPVGTDVLESGEAISSATV